MPKSRKTNKAKKPSKVGFIRSLPASMPVAQVVAKGKARGLKIAESYVHWARWQSKSAAKRTASKAAVSRATEPSSTNAQATTSKAAFVRSLPSSMPATEVIAKAKSAGFSISKTYVYVVRGSAEAVAKTKKATNGAGVRRAPIPRRLPRIASPTTSSVETLLKAVAAELGLGRAVDILEGERSRVRAVIGT